MKRTLIICPHFPLPETNGANMRTMHFVRYFEKLGPVDIAYFYGDPQEGAESLRFSNHFALERTKAQSVKMEIVLGVVFGQPFPLYRLRRVSKARLRKFAEANNYDHVVVRYLYSSAALFVLPKPMQRRALFDIDDDLSGSQYIGYTDGRVGRFSRMIFAGNRTLLRRYERRATRHSRALVCSPVDQARLATRNSVPTIVPNIFEPDRSSSPSALKGFHNPNRLLFVGSLDYPPNVEGLQWFLSGVFPDFLSEFPDAMFTVVGRNAPADFAALCAASPNVYFHPNVASVAHFYDECRAVVVPLLRAGGTRIKILEAAGFKRPVLSTTVGAEGLELRDGAEILHFSTATEFLDAYRKLDETTYLTLAERASEVVKARYSRDIFDDVVETTVAGLKEMSPRR